MRFFVSGYYGFKNTGDELILSKISQDLKSIDPDSDIVVWSGDPDYTKRIHRLDAVDRFSVDETYDAVKWADVVIVGGGGLIQEYFDLNPGNMFKQFGGTVASYSIPPFFAKVMNKPVFYWSQGFGPIFSKDGESFLRWFCSLSDVITVRDRYSFNLLKSFGTDVDNVYLDVDPVMAMDFSGLKGSLDFSSIPKDVKKVGVNIRPWFGIDGILNNMGDLFNAILKEYPDVVLVAIPFDFGLDLNILEKFVNMLPSNRVFLLTEDLLRTPLDVVLAVGAMDYMLGMRFHSVVVSALQGIPTLAFAYDLKVKSFCKDMKIPFVEVENFSSKELYVKFRHVFSGGDRIQGRSFNYKTPKIFSEYLGGKVVKDKTGEQVNSGMDKEDSIKSKFILVLKKDIKDKERKISSLEGELKSLRMENERLKQEKTEFEQLVHELRCSFDEQLQSIKLERDNLFKRLDEIYKSRFWKIAYRYYSLKEGLSDLIGLFTKKRKMASLIGMMKAMEDGGNGAKTFIYPPTVSWNIPLYQRPQHFAVELSKKGNLFIFCTPDGKHDGVKGVRFIRDKLVVTDLWHGLIGRLEGGNLILPSTNSNVDIGMMRDLKNRGVKIIYDYIDEIHQDIDKGVNFQIERHEMLGEEVVDLVCAVSRKLYMEMLEVFPEEKVIYLPNGCDYEHFHIEKDINRIPSALKEIVGKGKPIVGYYGALAKWIDYDLINYAAEKMRDLNFVLIGVDYDGSLKDLNLNLGNIHLLDPVSYRDLPYYGIWFDVAIIPFKEGDIAKATSPIKLFEYMAMNKPVVYTKGLEECSLYSSPLKADSREDFVEKLKEAVSLKDDVEYIALVDKEARENTWKKRVEKLLSALQLSGEAS